MMSILCKQLGILALLIYLVDVYSFFPSPGVLRRVKKEWTVSPFLPPAGTGPTTKLDLFRRNDDGDDAETNENDSEEKESLFARLLGRKEKSKVEEAAATTEEPPKQNRLARIFKSEKVKEKSGENTSVDKAKALQDQAARARLEAEKMDAELTLYKIEKLEKEISSAEKKGESTESLLEQVQLLQKKMDPSSDPEPVKERLPEVSSMSSTTRATTTTTAPSLSYTGAGSNIPFSQEVFDKALKDFQNTPDFMKITSARVVGLDAYDAKMINATEYALRVEQSKRLDFSFVKDIPPPVFSDDEVQQSMKSMDFGIKKQLLVDADVRNQMTDEQLARKFLEADYYTQKIVESTDVPGENRTSSWLDDVDLNSSSTDRLLTGIFPACINKNENEPTEAQAKLLASEVLPKVGFDASSGPRKVYGGYLISGINRKKNADELVDAIDAELAKSDVLKDRLNVVFMKDLSVLEDGADAIFDLPDALYVLGSDIAREPQRFLLTIVSALGLASSWYLSIYPFLLNPELMKRAQEQLSLAETSMQYDLSWLTDLSFPLFTTFLGIQMTHELGHSVVASIYNMNLTVPTFVPSFATGITSTITSLKSPAKNRNQLFDFAVSGPLTGLLVSLGVLFLGLQLTAQSDPQTAVLFPALPLEILRQSSLGGGIIEAVLGQGILSVPEGAAGSQIVSSINIPLHPIAVAGYISIFVNALSVLPIGVTDGGRMIQTVVGRLGKTFFGGTFLAVLLFAGLLGDDLFLFYFFFCFLFQQGSEIPLRNEVDDLSFPRVVLGLATGVVALLCLIPMQT